jgi:hypothetical protein
MSGGAWDYVQSKVLNDAPLRLSDLEDMVHAVMWEAPDLRETFAQHAKALLSLRADVARHYERIEHVDRVKSFDAVAE